MNNWILPEERLPESDNRCRLYIVTITVPAFPGQRSRWVTTARYYGKSWVQTNENGSHYLEIGGVKVVAWRNEAEFISRFWSKGRMILVEGELQNRKYTDKSGTERQVTELIVDRACFTGEKTERDVPPPPEEPPQYKKQEKPAEQQPAEAPTAADDYPF